MKHMKRFVALFAALALVLAMAVPAFADTAATGSITINNADLKATTTGNTYTNGGVKVVNKAGTTLPGTGGIGTTIFYLIGGGLMVAAAVLLIAKKRMENK